MIGRGARGNYNAAPNRARRQTRATENQMLPKTKYAGSDNALIAYQVTGGSVDVVMPPGTMSHLDLDSEIPRRASPGATESHLAEQMRERLTDLKCFVAMLQTQHRVPPRVSRHLGNGIHVHDGGTMDLPEFGGVQHVEQLL